MRVPISWLKTFVDIDLPVDVLADRLNRAGIEVDLIEGVGAFDTNVVVGELRQKKEVAGKDAVNLIVDIGERLLQIASKAVHTRDIAPGNKLVIATSGARLIDAAAADFQINTVGVSEVFGIKSQGVLVSAKQLGIGRDNTALILGPGASIGSHLIDTLTPQPDWEADQVLVLSVLANTARIQSIIGTAREVAAITGAALHETIEKSDVPKVDGSLLPSAAVGPELCKRFSVAKVDKVNVMSSPRWLQRRLVLSGVKPINNIVDAANYVMLELGQPLHTYDADLLPSLRLGVRLSGEGESLHTLTQPYEDEPLSLPGGILIIESNDTPVAVAGVVGGTRTAINNNTKSILIESANFDFISIRKSQTLLKIYSEASARFSRGTDPGITQQAITRLLKLLGDTSPSLEVMGGAALSRFDAEPREIETTLTEVNDALGTEFSLSDLVRLLDKAQIQTAVNEDQQTLRAFISSSRDDLQIPADLWEEFVRLDGYDRLVQSMPSDPIPMHKRNVELELRESSRDALVQWGLQEAITYTLTDPRMEQRLHVGSSEPWIEPQYVRLKNPISSERTVMRRTLLPGLLDVVRSNLRYAESCHLFEIGVVVVPELPSPTPQLPAEPYCVALALTGPFEPRSLFNPEPRETDFYDAVNAIEFFLRHMNLHSLSFTPSHTAPFQPGVCAAVKSDDVILGHVGALHPFVAAAFDLADRRVFCAELDLEEIIRCSRRFFLFREPPRFPSISLDISAVVQRHLPAGELANVVRAVRSDFLRSVSIFDIYEGPQVPEGHKAVGLRLELNATTHTLTIEEAHAVRDMAAARLREEFQAIIRE